MKTVLLATTFACLITPRPLQLTAHVVLPLTTHHLEDLVVVVVGTHEALEVLRVLDLFLRKSVGNVRVNCVRKHLNSICE